MSLCGTEGTCQGGLLGESNEFIQEGGTEGEAGKGSSVQHVLVCSLEGLSPLIQIENRLTGRYFSLSSVPSPN